MGSTAIRFGVLGPLRLYASDGTPLDPGGPRPRALLTLLLVDAGRLLSTERLLRGVYGAEPPAGAVNALQSQVSRLRRRIAPTGARIERTASGYRLLVEDVGAVDAHAFARLAARGRRDLEAGDPAAAATSLRAALALWHGQALQDLPQLTEHVARLEELRRTALASRIEADLLCGAAADIVPELRALLTKHPVNERLHLLLMRALQHTGQPADALTVFEQARRLLAERLGADPSPELVALHAELLRATPAETAALPLTGLPEQLTRFVGREEELAALTALVAEERLVTLTGPGGTGKTRLATEAARRQPLPVCLVEFAPLRDGANVPYAALTALGVRDGFRAPRGDVTGRLLSTLRGRSLLLVMDNCEHVLDDAARCAARILAACPGIRVLTTSREALGITGEVVRPVPPLPHATAVRLFRERAAAVRPAAGTWGTANLGSSAADSTDGANGDDTNSAGDGTATGREDEDVASAICSVLDGLPLAIELAAARLRTLAPQELAERLTDRFHVLSRGDRTKPSRHRTLRAVVEWSWDLLSAEEQALARALSVFADGARAEAVAAVCTVPGSADVLDSLVEKSFVDVAEGRYRMLETVRAFCAERAEDAGETGQLRDAHAAYFRRTAEEAEPLLRGSRQLDLLDRLAAERADLDAALGHLVAHRPRTALRMMAALSWFWRLRGLYAQQASTARDLLTAVGDDLPTGLEEEYVLCLLNTLSEPLDGAVELDVLDRIDAVLSTTEAPMRFPFIAVLQSFALGPRPRTDRRIVRLLSGTPWASALLLLGSGYLEWLAGRPRPAEESFARSLESFRGTGDRWGMANCLDMLALFADWAGDRGRALALLDEALLHVRALGSQEEIADVLMRRSSVVLHGGDLPAARALLLRAGELYRSAGLPDKPAAALRGLGDVARLSGDTKTARECYEAARASLSGSWYSVGEDVRALLGLGRTALAEGDAGAAQAWTELARQRAVSAEDRGALADAHEALAALCVAASAAAEGQTGHGAPGTGRPGRRESSLRAAELLGAAQTLRGASPDLDPFVVHARAWIRSELGEAAYDEAVERGGRTAAAGFRQRSGPVSER